MRANNKAKAAFVASVVTTMVSLFLFSFGVRHKKINIRQIRRWFAEALSKHKAISGEELEQGKYRVDQIYNRESDGSPIQVEIKHFHPEIPHHSSSHISNVKRGPKALYSGVNIEWVGDESEYYSIYLSKSKLGQEFINWLFSSENDVATSHIKAFDDDPVQIIILENSTDWLRKYDYNVSDELDVRESSNILPAKFSLYIPLEEFHCIIVSEQGNVSREYFHSCDEDEKISNASPYNFQYILSKHKGKWNLSIVDKNFDKKEHKDLSIVICHNDDLVSEFPLDSFRGFTNVVLKNVDAGICYLKYLKGKNIVEHDFAAFISEINPWSDEAWYKDYFEEENFDKLSIFTPEETP